MLLMYVLISDWSVQGVQFESSTQALVVGEDRRMRECLYKGRARAG